MDKFQNKYRIQSHRFPSWDYSGNGIYFITFVTQNRECILGEIKNSFMGNNDRRLAFSRGFTELNELLESDDLNVTNGAHAETHGLHVETHGRASLPPPPSPQQTPIKSPPSNRHVELNSYIQFSDFGRIVNDEWLKSFELREELYLDEYIIMPNHLHAIVIIEKIPKRDPVEQIQNQIGFIRKPKSISSFVAGFKSAVNSKIDDFIDEHNLDIPKYNRNNHFFQVNYHDHIIRNNEEYHRIKEYILTNPLKWNDDSFNPNKTSE